MNSKRQPLLRRQELLHQGLMLAGAYVEEARFDYLEDRIERVRPLQVPGPILSQFDALSPRYLEPMSAVSRNRSQCCPHCERLLYPHERSPSPRFNDSSSGGSTKPTRNSDPFHQTMPRFQTMTPVTGLPI
jgi:hypothetical protein